MEATSRARVFRTSKTPATRTPESAPGRTESQLNISVVFTSVDQTLAALKTAGALANRLQARITLIVPEVVSYQLPLNCPPVQHAWNKRRFRVLAANSSVETTVRFYLCRDRNQTLTRILKPHSLVVLGGAKHWWPTDESRLARRLRKAGHEVILAETE